MYTIVTKSEYQSIGSLLLVKNLEKTQNMQRITAHYDLIIRFQVFIAINWQFT